MLRRTLPHALALLFALLCASPALAQNDGVTFTGVNNNVSSSSPPFNYRTAFDQPGGLRRNPDGSAVLAGCFSMVIAGQGGCPSPTSYTLEYTIFSNGSVVASGTRTNQPMNNGSAGLLVSLPPGSLPMGTTLDVLLRLTAQPSGLCTGSSFSLTIDTRRGTESFGPEHNQGQTVTRHGPGSFPANICGMPAACQSVNGFTASASVINAGQSTTLSYNLSGATSATVTDLLTGAVTTVPVQSGSLVVTPASTRAYRLSAEGACATVTQDVTVTVNQPPSVSSFTASPSSVCAGQSTTLSWSSGGAASATITDLLTGAVTSVPVNGSLAVTPATTRAYRLTVTSGAGSAAQDVTVTVNPLASINSFSASPAAIASGGSSSLSFGVSNSTSRSITDLSTGAVTTLGAESGAISVSPTSTRTYRLSAQNGCNTVTQDVTVTVTSCQAISSFSASATTINSGQSTTLSYVLTGATSATVTDLASGAVTTVPVQSGSLVVTPASTRAYRLTVSGPCATLTQDITVTVVQPPSITSLTASPTSVCAGASTTLSWSSSGATSATVTDLLTGAVTTVAGSGSMTVTPATTRTYRLTATNGAGSVTQDVAVTVTQPATVNSFTASPTSVNAGQSAALSFNVSNTTSRTITDLSTGAVITLGAESGTQVVTPATTRTYRLTATNGCSSVTSDVTVKVTQTPTISAFTAGASPVCSGGASTLSWTATGGASATISAPGLPGSPVSVNPNGGSLVVNPASTTTYTLTVTNGAGSATRTVTVAVTPAPAVSTFTASPTTVNSGQSATLSWASSNGTSATVTDLLTGQVTAVPVNGSLAVTPASTRAYRLSVAGGCGTATQDVTVTVTQAPVISDFNAGAGSVCAGGSTTLSWSASGGTSATVSAPGLPGSPVSVNPAGGTLNVSPAATTTYTLTVSNGAGSDTRAVTVSVSPAPSVSSFAASAASIVQGQSTELTFSTADATSATITDLLTGQVTSVPPNGALTVSPASTRTYRLTATGPCGSVTQDVTVTVTSCQSITAFTASPAAVNQGQAATLSYSLSGATSATITDLLTGAVTNVPVQSGSLAVTPASTRAYRLTASGPCATVTQDVTVTVAGTPAIVSFAAAAPSVCSGAQATLNYSTSNVTSADVNGVPVPTLPDGSLTVTPSAPHTDYVMTARGGAGGATTVTQTVRVTAEPAPSINSYSASPAGITAGQSTTLTWDGNDGASASVTDLSSGQVFNVPADGSLAVSPATTRAYRLTVTNGCSSVSQDVTVTVAAASCQTITSFTASPSVLLLGQGATLSWTTQGATSVDIINLTQNTPNLVGGPPNGSYGAAADRTTVFRLVAHGPCAPATQDVTVTYCPTANFSTFTASPNTVNSGQSTTLSWYVPSAASVTIAGVGTFPGESGSVSVSPTATTTYTLTAAGGSGCSPLTMQTPVTVITGEVLIGPAGQPAAVGPASNHDDYTNMTMTVGVAAAQGGLTTSSQQVTFVNTVRNGSSAADNISLSLQSVPGPPFSNAYQISVDGGVTYQPFTVGGPAVVVAVPAMGNYDVRIRVTAPAGQPVLAGYSAVVRATSGITPANYNETIDRLWTGFIRVDKTQSVTNSTGAGGPSAAVPGAVIRYSLAYSNVTPAASGAGNVELFATNLTLTEDGAAAPNNWAGTTTHVAGSATDSRGGVITGDAAGSSLIRAVIARLDPQESGVFAYSRRIR